MGCKLGTAKPRAGDRDKLLLALYAIDLDALHLLWRYRVADFPAHIRSEDRYQQAMLHVEHCRLQTRAGSNRYREPLDAFAEAMASALCLNDSPDDESSHASISRCGSASGAQRYWELQVALKDESTGFCCPYCLNNFPGRRTCEEHMKSCLSIIDPNVQPVREGPTAEAAELPVHPAFATPTGGLATHNTNSHSDAAARE